MKCQKNKKCVKSNPEDIIAYLDWKYDTRQFCTGCNKQKKDKKD